MQIQSFQTPENTGQKHQNLSWRNSYDDRTAGRMAVWQKPQNASENNVLALKPTETTQTDESFSFWDILDMINPLQHLPIIGHVYRAITGDTMKAPARIIGGAAFGGPLGAAAGIVNTVSELETGRDLTGNVLAFVTSERDAPRGKDFTDLVSAVQTDQYWDNTGTAIAKADLRKQPVYNS